MKNLLKYPRIILAFTAILVAVCSCPPTPTSNSNTSGQTFQENPIEEATEEPTEEPTEQPTEAPAPTDAPTEAAPLQPYLTGTFTTCDNAARYVNFTIADPAAPFAPVTHKVLFNGVEATCTRAASAFDVLTCIYPPAPYGPPATIEVIVNGERVNEFNFDGGEICNPVKAPNTEEPEEPQPTEAPTEAPTEPPTEVPTEPTD